jgi:DNA-binding response OmpR family regulator
MRLLVIEDSVRLQENLGTALRRSGYAVDLASDGEAGLWCWKQASALRSTVALDKGTLSG